MRTLVILGIVVALFARPASANTAAVVDVVNKSGTCAWVTYYWSKGSLDTWTISHGQTGYINNDPKWVKPGETSRFSNPWPEAKVQAEFTKNADCSGGIVKKAWDTRKDLRNDTRRVVNLVKQPDGYWAWFE